MLLLRGAGRRQFRFFRFLLDHRPAAAGSALLPTILLLRSRLLLLLFVQQLVLAHLGERRQVGGVAVAARAVHVEQDLLVRIDFEEVAALVRQVAGVAAFLAGGPNHLLGGVERGVVHWGWMVSRSAFRVVLAADRCFSVVDNQESTNSNPQQSVNKTRAVLLLVLLDCFETRLFAVR